MRIDRKPLRLTLAALVTLFGACTTAPPAPVVQTPAPAPVAIAPPAVEAPAVRPAPMPTPKHLHEADWRRAAAEHIHGIHQARIFPGRPPHPLKAVVVLQLTVGPDGRVHRADVLRAPEHAKHLGSEAVRLAMAASPLPPPPAQIVARGSLRITETWLFRADEQFQLRTLALTQDLRS